MHQRLPKRSGAASTWSFFVLAWHLLSLSVSFSAERQLQFDVFVGFGDVGKEGCWIPLVCELKNDGPAFPAVVEVTDGPSRQATRMEVELPTGTLKRVTIPVYCPGGGYASWDVRLLSTHGRVISERLNMRLRNIARNEVPLIGVISRSMTGTPQIKETAIKNNPQMRPEAVRLLPQLFPENPLLLECLSGIYLNSERVAGLNQGQTSAIVEWMRQGGHLILAVEQPQDLDGAAWLRGFLPIRFTGVRSLTPGSTFDDWLRDDWPSERIPRRVGHNQPPHRRASPTAKKPPLNDSETRPFRALDGDPKFNTNELRVAIGELGSARVQVSADGVPLVFTKSVGRGKLTVLPFSPEREPFQSWKHAAVFWARLAEVPGAWFTESDFQQYGGFGGDSVFGAMIETVQARKLPLGSLLLMLLGYVFLIGPFDYMLVRRLGRPGLTWITFPCYVAGFAVFIYLVGFRLRAGDLEWNEMHIVDVSHGREGPQPARGRSYFAIYSPGNRTYELRGPATTALFRGESGGWYGGGNKNNISVQILGDTFRGETDVPVWTSQLFTSDWLTKAEMPFKLTLKGSGQGFEVACENPGAVELTVACLTSNRVIQLGKVAQGSRQSFQVAPTSGLDATTEWTANWPRIQSAVQSRHMAFRQSMDRESGKLQDWLLVTQLISSQQHVEQAGYQAFSSDKHLNLSDALSEPGSVVVFVATLAPPPAVPTLGFKTQKSQRMTIWRVIAQIEPTGE